MRYALVERSNGELLLGPPKSRAGRRIVGIPDVIIPALREHLSRYVQADPDAWFFPSAKVGPLRRGNSNKMSGWPDAVRSLGLEGLDFHDLRHTGNQFTANSGMGLKDLMARMGHDMIYLHEAQEADQRITDAIDTHAQAVRRDDDKDDGGAARVLVPAG